MRLSSGVLRLALTGLGLLVATLFPQLAKADAYDFSCGSGSCTGTVVSNGNFSTTGIGLTSNVPGEGADTFSLVFDTSTNSIQILENGSPDFVGTIMGASSSSGVGFTLLNLSVNWTTLPGDVNGTSGTTPFSSVISLATSGGGSTYSAYSVDVPISTDPVAAPEPSTLLLCLVGLVTTALALLKRSVVA